MKYFVLMFALMLIGCSNKNTSLQKIGFWVNEKPYRGTLDKNKFHIRPYWQCVEPFSPYKNKEC